MQTWKTKGRKSNNCKQLSDMMKDINYDINKKRKMDVVSFDVQNSTALLYYVLIQYSFYEIVPQAYLK